RVRGRMCAGQREDRIDDRSGKERRQHDLLEETTDDQRRRARKVDLALAYVAGELRKELRPADDRTGHEMREEGEVDREVERASRRDDAPVDVDDVADPHEREEGDANRQRDLYER